MREIKFRAWDGKKMLPPEDLSIAPEHRKWLGHIDVELLQYTGLNDKNGVEIYEGDVVSVCQSYGDCESRTTHLVTFGNKVGDYPAFTFDYGVLDDDDGWNALYLAFAEEVIEVIGNIHENPGLL